MPMRHGAWTDGVEAGVRSVTVGDLMTHVLQHPEGPWALADVQRGPKWGPDRVARLLDSLLAGYPIGTLLLCRLRDEGNRNWVLLDGQQRVNALTSLLTSRADTRVRFLLDLVKPKPTEEEVAVDKEKRIAATDYIRRRDRIAEADGWAEPLDRREWHLDLSRFAAWADGDGTQTRPIAALRAIAGLSPTPEGDLESVPGILNLAIDRASMDPRPTDRDDLAFLAEVDPECRVSSADGLTAEMLARVRERVARLLAVWFAEIPVEARDLDSAYDILQAFERIESWRGAGLARGRVLRGSPDAVEASSRPTAPDRRENERTSRKAGCSAAPV